MSKKKSLGEEHNLRTPRKLHDAGIELTPEKLIAEGAARHARDGSRHRGLRRIQEVRRLPQGGL